MEARYDVEKEVRCWIRDHFGIISRGEGRDLGQTLRQMRRKVEIGEWEELYDGVYRTTVVAPSPYQGMRAAYLASRKAGVLSHTSAAWLWGLTVDEPTPVELSIPRGVSAGRRVPNIVLHRCRDLDWSSAHSRLHGLPVTNPLRTIVDLAAILPPDALTDVIDKALASRLVTPAGLSAELEQLARPGRQGVAILRRHLLDRGFIGAPPPSVLEAKTRRLLRLPGVAFPTIEHHAGPDGEYRLDFAWVEILLALEVDGYVWHFTPEHQRRDLRRRNTLQGDGWTVLVYTWLDVCRHPSRVACEVRANYYRLAQAAE